MEQLGLEVQLSGKVFAQYTQALSEIPSTTEKERKRSLQEYRTFKKCLLKVVVVYVSSLPCYQGYFHEMFETSCSSDHITLKQKKEQALES